MKAGGLPSGSLFWGGGVFLVLDQARRVDTQVLHIPLLLPRATSCSNPRAAGLCACPEHKKRACLSKSLNICTSGALATCWEIPEIAVIDDTGDTGSLEFLGSHFTGCPVFPGDKMPFPCRVLEHKLGPLPALALTCPVVQQENGNLNQQCSGSFSVGYSQSQRCLYVKSSNDLFFLF